jgi:CheY-like chemotaxis protein
LLRPTLGEHIEIDALHAADVSLALVDPNLLSTTILNLAVMARDGMPEGGKLIFETRNAVSEEGCAGVEHEIGVANHIMVAVNASGRAAYSDRAFADIGMVRDFIKQSNGHINVRNDAGRGTSVKMYLPRASGCVQPLAEDSGEADDEAILIVEDDDLVRRYVVTQVESLGCRTFAAGNASEALTIIDKGAKIDLLFTDVVMPGSLNRWQLAVEALHRKPALKILYTSGYAKNNMSHDRHLDADVLLLTKPYRKVDLAKMIGAALAA